MDKKYVIKNMSINQYLDWFDSITKEIVFTEDVFKAALIDNYEQAISILHEYSKIFPKDIYLILEVYINY